MNRRGFLGLIAMVAATPLASLRAAVRPRVPLMLNLPIKHYAAGDRIILGRTYPTMPVIGDTIRVRLPQQFTVKVEGA